jgi:hypothetical protein
VLEKFQDFRFIGLRNRSICRYTIGVNQEPLKELDERDMIEPLKETSDSTDDQHQENESDTPEDMVAGEQEMTVDGVDELVGSDDDNNETKIDPDVDDESSEKEKQSAKDPQKDPAENNILDDSVALDDDEVDGGIDDKLNQEEASADGHEKKEDARADQAEKIAAEDPDPGEVKEIDKKEKAPLKNTAKNQKRKKVVKGAASSRKIFVSAFIIVMIAGYIIYSKPALLGIVGQAEKALSVKTEPMQPALPEQIPVPKPPGKHDFFVAKLEEVDRLRDDLLAKKEEIYRLKLHYQNGIDELKDKIGREIREANISSYARALMNKRMELDLRTIQRRQAYIQGLEKPDRWVHKGSEELLFLKRKGLLDLQTFDIASGIDLDRHMRYMNAAIQTYQPSAEKLAVDPRL